MTAERAEEVRAFLVGVRGGAPFLSSHDGRLLLAWLEAGVAVTTILRGIEATAERRRAKRLRTKFTLVSCRKAVETGAQGSTAAPTEPAACGTEEAELTRATAAAIAAVKLPDLEARARARCVLARAFHERLWDLLAPERSALRAEAASALADLADTLDPAVFENLCEEWARESVRRRHPAFSPTHIWEDAALGME